MRRAFQVESSAMVAIETCKDGNRFVGGSMWKVSFTAQFVKVEASR